MIRFFLAILFLFSTIANAVDYEFVGGSANKFVLISLYNSSDGSADTGVVFNSVTASYMRNNAAADVAQTAVTMSLGSHADYGWIEVDATNAPGLYQYGVPDAAIADGAESVILSFKITGAVPKFAHISIIDVDLRNGANIAANTIQIEGGDATDALDTALTNYDGPTNAEMEARTIIAASYFDFTTDNVITDSASRTASKATEFATSAALATAQTDLDTITGSDGVTLATAQALYAPAKAGDAMALTAAAIDDIWDEALTKGTHDVSQSAAKRLRELSGLIITADTARGSGIGNNQIQLAVGASSNDGAYDPGLVAIIDGTGAGQMRGIFQYEGSSQTATVDRNWKVNPNSDSEYIILGDTGREHVNEGLAQAGYASAIKLNALASTQNNAYNGQTIFIRSGTGEDQARVVLDYDGTTLIATTVSAWDIIPDTTSAYAMLPTAPGIIDDVHLTVAAVQVIVDAMWDELKSSHTTANSFGDYLDTEVSGVGGGTAAQVADAVWDEAQIDHTSVGTFGKVVNDLDTGTTVSDITTATLAKFMTIDTGETIGAAGSVAKIAQGAAGGNVTVGSMTQAALAQFATDDTGETTVVDNSVADLARGSDFGVGTGSTTLEFLDANSDPIIGAKVWITSDIEGVNVVAGNASTLTNSSGKITFLLNTGTRYYAWMQKDGYNDVQAQGFVAE